MKIKWGVGLSTKISEQTLHQCIKYLKNMTRIITESFGKEIIKCRASTFSKSSPPYKQAREKNALYGLGFLSASALNCKS